MASSDGGKINFDYLPDSATVPAANDLAVTVTDWAVVDLQAQALSFQ